jgi:hypothetical protein
MVRPLGVECYMLLIHIYKHMNPSDSIWITDQLTHCLLKKCLLEIDDLSTVN